MYELLFADVHADVRHLAFNVKKQKIAYLQVITADRYCRGPELAGRTWQAFPGMLIGKLHQSTAIKTAPR